MAYKQSVNLFIPVDRYEEIRALSRRLDVSNSEVIRRGIVLVLKKYKGKESTSSRGVN